MCSKSIFLVMMSSSVIEPDYKASKYKEKHFFLQRFRALKHTNLLAS